MPKKTLLVIAAVAVMLVAATSAYGYHEVWNGWFNSGQLTYFGATFEYVEGQSTVEDTTAGSVDSFTIHAIPYRSFYCAATGYTIRLWVHTATGSKPTGQEDQKEGSGDWAGTAVLKGPFASPVNFAIWGTWASTGNHFNYDTEPPTYTAEWRISNSDPDDLEGQGTSSGKLLE